MKNQRLHPLKNKKGVSHIFSNVLILLVIIIASSLAFTYVATYVGEYQSGRGAVLLQRLLFEDVWFKNNQIVITVYNYGRVSCKVIAVFIDYRQFPITSPAEGYVTIAVEDRETIAVDFVWVSGSAHNLKLLTERGYTVERDYEAP
jgi:hypothetical protein